MKDSYAKDYGSTEEGGRHLCEILWDTLEDKGRLPNPMD